ncbi:MAG TPA: hypothetical protein VGF89_07375 [Steroidobacteraceae bacterium]|jgi:hypothetical protein
MRSSCVLSALLLASPLAAPAGDWTQFRDPTEGAFTIDVPNGWQVVGGLKRRSVNQPHPLLGVVSPDGLTKIVLGDPSAIAYSELTDSMQGLGFREGQSYTPHGEPELINSYHTGEQWSQTLATRELQQDGCSNVQVTSHRALPKPPGGLASPPGVEHRDSIGETYLSCVRNGILYVGYAFSETSGDYYYQGSQVIAGAWGDDTSVVLLTPQGMGGFAMAIANHMLQSMRWDGAWWQRQFHAAVAQADALYAQATHTIAQQGQSWDQTVRGVESYVNPATGKKWEVPMTGANNFAQDGAGHIIGLTGSQAPPGFTLMKKATP